MRPLIFFLCALLSILWMGITIGCTEKDDTGKACGESLTPQPASPVPGETTINEVVILQRDTQCLALHCLEHQGLPAYCTKECNVAPSNSGSPNCQSSEECAPTAYCKDHRCVEDNCAPGFWCQKVQSVGPISTQSFCVRKTDCRTNSDCGELGSVDCIQYGCLDECLLNPECTSHQLLCIPQPELPCVCKEGGASLTGACADEDLICKTPNASENWPVSSVIQQGICTPREEK